jgi:hypothetical protein
MKTILKIIIILLVAAVVAGAFSLAVNKNSTTVLSDGGQPPATTGSTSQVMTRPEGGDHDGGSATGGLAGVLSTLLKLTGITILVLVLQKGFRQLGSLRLKMARE